MNLLPSNFVSKITSLQNYSKSPIRILPQSQSSVLSNQIVKLTLPVGTVLDMKTFSLYFDFNTVGATNAKLVGMPKYTSSLIDTLEIWVNGRNIQNTPRYNNVYSIFQDFKNNHNALIKKMGTNPDPSVYSTLAADGAIGRLPTKYGTGSIGTNDFRGTYCINSWMGFLDANPNIIDTNLLGQIEIVLKLASTRVLWGHGLVDADAIDFKLDNIVAYCDQIYFKDENYYSVIKGLMQSSDGFKIVYPNYMVYTGDTLTNNKKTTLKITENCSSLDMILFTFLDTSSTGKQALQLGDAAAAADEAEAFAGKHIASRYVYDNVLAQYDKSLLNNSVYFRRNGVGCQTVQFEINSQDVTVPMNTLEQWGETLKAFELNVDADNKQINPSIKDLSIFQKDFYVCALSTSHINNKDEDLGSLISGRDTMASSLNITVKSIGSSTADPAQGGCQSCIITKFTSRLHVSGERNIFPVR